MFKLEEEVYQEQDLASPAGSQAWDMEGRFFPPGRVPLLALCLRPQLSAQGNRVDLASSAYLRLKLEIQLK